MRLIIFFLFILIPLIMIFGFKLIQILYYLEKVTYFQQENYTLNTTKNGVLPKNILLINSAGGFGGAEMHTICEYKNLIKNGNKVTILVLKDSGFETKLKELKISYYAYKKFKILGKPIQPGLANAIEQICLENKVKIIHCNIHRETIAAKSVAKKLSIKTVLTLHNPQHVNPKYLENLDAFIGVNPQIAQDIKNQNLKIKVVEFIPPFYEEESYLNFKPTEENKAEFFKNHFDIDIENLPVLCTIANMPKNINHKNHPFLLDSIAKLIKIRNKPIHLMLVGDGTLKEQLQKQTQELEIGKYVHFLGFTDKVAQILYHSDIKVLTSKHEGLPIVIFEAGLLKKAVIVSDNTSMTTLIIDHKTGMLYKQDMQEDLLDKIEELLNNPDLRKTLGQNLFDYIQENFSTKICLKKLEEVYERIS